MRVMIVRLAVSGLLALALALAVAGISVSAETLVGQVMGLSTSLASIKTWRQFA